MADTVELISPGGTKLRVSEKAADAWRARGYRDASTAVDTAATAKAEEAPGSEPEAPEQGETAVPPPPAVSPVGESADQDDETSKEDRKAAVKEAAERVTEPIKQAAKKVSKKATKKSSEE